MTSISLLIIIASLVTLLVIGTEDMGSGHTVFANRGISGHVTNRGINVQTDNNQNQGCESTGRTSGITNACTATSTPGSTQTSVALTFRGCICCGDPLRPPTSECLLPTSPNFCNNIGCQSITCAGIISPVGSFNCVTNNGVQLTSCTGGGPLHRPINVSCPRTVPSTGITNSGGVSG